MKFKYIVQPPDCFGDILINLISTAPRPKEIIFTAAYFTDFAARLLIPQLMKVMQSGCEIKLVLGTDDLITTKDVLEQILKSTIPCHIFKNAIDGHKFHPKAYIIRRDKWADIIVGSNNVTKGGFTDNFEISSKTTYIFPDDQSDFDEAMEQLSMFTQPSTDLSKPLTRELIDELYAAGEIVSADDLKIKIQSDSDFSSMLPDAPSPFTQSVEFPRISEDSDDEIPAHIVRQRSAKIKYSNTGDIEIIHDAFIQGFKDYLKVVGVDYAFNERHDHYCQMTKPGSPFENTPFALVVTQSSSQRMSQFPSPEIRVEIFSDHENAKDYFNQLRKHADKIHRDLGEDVIWDPGRQGQVVIYFAQDVVDLADTDEWESQFKWLLSKIIKALDVFPKYIREISGHAQGGHEADIPQAGSQ